MRNLFSTFCLCLIVISQLPLQAAENFLSPVQERVLAPYFKPEQIIVSNLADYASAGLAFTWDQPKRQLLLTLNFGKSVLLPSQGIKTVYHFEIKHSSLDQGVREPFRCRPNEQRQELQSPQLGRFIACNRLNTQGSPGQSLGLLSAQIYPILGNRASHIQISYIGSQADLVQVVQSLRSYR